MNNYKITDFRPLHDNIIVKPIKLLEKEVKGKDGKVIKFARPQQEEDKSELGEVISVGQAAQVEVGGRPVIYPGDVVLYNKYSTVKTDLGEELVVRYEDVVAVLNK